MANILVRDYTEEQKKCVEAAADKAGKSTSKYIRDESVKAAGGKVEGEAGKVKANGAAPKGAVKKLAPTKPSTAKRGPVFGMPVIKRSR